MRRHLGFTLTELLIVMAITAIMVGLAMPSMIGGVRRERLHTAARYAIGLVGLARARAVNLHLPTRVVFDTERGEMWVQARTQAEQEDKLVLGQWQDLRTSDFVRRRLPLGVRVVRVGYVEGEEWSTEAEAPTELEQSLPPGTVTLKLMPNGTAEPKCILLANESGERTLIRIDRVTGLPQVFTDDELRELELELPVSSAEGGEG